MHRRLFGHYTPWWALVVGTIQQLCIGLTTWLSLFAASSLGSPQGISENSLIFIVIGIFLTLLAAYFLGMIEAVIQKRYEARFWLRVIEFAYVSRQENEFRGIPSKSHSEVSDQLITEFRDVLRDFVFEVSHSWQMLLSIIISILVIGMEIGLAVAAVFLVSIGFGIVCSNMLRKSTLESARTLSNERVRIASVIRNELGIRGKPASKLVDQWQNSGIRLDIIQSLPGIVMLTTFTALLVVLYFFLNGNSYVSAFLLIVAVPRLIQLLSYARELFEKRARFVELQARWTTTLGSS